MNASLMILELAVVVLALTMLLMDLWTTPERKRLLGYGAAAALLLVLGYSFFMGMGDSAASRQAISGSYVLDPLALFFKRFFLVAAIVVLIMAVDFADRIEAGIAEFYSLILFALSGMMFAASANHFSMLFVSVELITVTFYVLTSFQRGRLPSLEAGLKYLVLGALSTGFTVYGIALVYGTAGTMNFNALAAVSANLVEKPLFLVGLLLVFVGLGFKIAAFPFQIWAPDVYQGSPAPITAFLAVGSKAAGFVLLLRLLFSAVPQVSTHWVNLLVFVSAATILYGNLCAIPQRNVKRLLGYSSISHAGYLLLGVAAMAASGTRASDGASAIMYYLGGYLFTVLAAFAVLIVALRHVEGEDVSSLACLNERAPLLAVAMTLAMVSLAGIPPLAGFFGKFLLFKAALDQGAHAPALYWLVGIAIAGVVISIWYYFGIIRVMYWSTAVADSTPIRVSRLLQIALYVCIAGMLLLGLSPEPMLKTTRRAAAVFQGLQSTVGQAGVVPAPSSPAL
jgi:NADH-quinone oxidoreductase subunit N